MVGWRGWLTLLSGLLVTELCCSALTSLTSLNMAGDTSGLQLTRDLRYSKFVTFSIVGASGYCRNDSADWRAWMPIYLARTLGLERPLLMWDSSPLNDRPGRCRICWTGDRAEQYSFFDCGKWLKERGLTQTRFMIVAGTDSLPRNTSEHDLLMPSAYRGMYKALHQPWVNNNTRLWHFPISRNSYIIRNRVFRKQFRNFNVMKDSGWVKPVIRPGLEAWVDGCSMQQKQKDLLYIGRFHPWKGQMDFLSMADPNLLHGYTVHFYTSVTVDRMTNTFPDDLERKARERGIKIVVHARSQSMHVLSNHSCHAMGLLHYARIDANPRVATESIINGMPLFVSKQSNIPHHLQKQKFVQMASNDENGRHELNRDLRDFMRLISDNETLRSVTKFAREVLYPPKAFSKLFSQIGVLHDRQARDL